MDKKAAIILRDLLIVAIETYREDEDDNEKQLLDIAYEEFKKAKEGILLSPQLSQIMFRLDQEMIEDFLATPYAMEMCSLIPDASARAAKLKSIITMKKMDSLVEKYIEEAIRCYVYGFFLASAIMCRGSIEYSLKKHLEKDSNIIYFKINDLLEEAVKRGSISETQKDEVREMYTAQSKIIHGKRQIDSGECLKYLNITKLIIEKLL